MSSSSSAVYDDEKGFFSLAPAQSFLPKRRSHRILGFLALLVVAGTLGRFYVGTERAAELYFNVKTLVTWSSVPVDPLIEQLLSPSLIGLDVSYIERELSTDFANYGGLDASVDPETGGSRAAGYNALAIAIPNPSINPIFEQYRGLRCSSRFPLSTCPFPGQCPTAADDAPERVKSGFPCAVWAEGRPAALTTALNRGGMTRMDTRDHRSTRVAWDWDREGLWRSQFWQPLSSPEATRPYHYFTPAQSHQCLAGRRVLFLGDSMVRQSFTKLVSYLRGIPIACEHAAERTPAAYYVFADGTDLYDPSASHGSHPEALFSVFYEYHDTHHDSYAKVLSNNIDTIFNGIVYSQPGSRDLHTVQKGIDRLFARGWRGTLTWYLTPQKNHQDRYEFKDRNDHMRRFTTYMRGNYTNIAFNSVPADKLTSRAAGFSLARNRAGGAHPDQFGCSFNTAAPTDIQPGLSAIYAPPGFDTRDLYNWNVIQLWLNGVCDLSSLH